MFGGIETVRRMGWRWCGRLDEDLSVEAGCMLYSRLFVWLKEEGLAGRWLHA